ncbi:hypothetical protein GGF31_008878 [Allomyces arbusculus]|nr:hypothetical protein GGF31_008878 [Allomyces arbusculus]
MRTRTRTTMHTVTLICTVIRTIMAIRTITATRTAMAIRMRTTTTGMIMAIITPTTTPTITATHMRTGPLWSAILAAATVALFYIGHSHGSLALQSYAFLFLFDLGGLGNVLFSSCLSNGLIVANDPEHYSFGVQRLEVVYAFCNALSLLFGGMYALKESLEHVLQPEEHAEHVGSVSVLIPIVFAALGIVGTVHAKIHHQYHNLTARTHPTDWPHHPSIQAHILASLILIARVWVQAMYAAAPARTVVHVVPVIDAAAAAAIGVFVLMRRAAPLAAATGHLLMQATDDADTVARVCAQIAADPDVAQILGVQCWRAAWRHRVGSLHVQVRAGADSAAVRARAHAVLAGSPVAGEWWVQTEKGGHQWI